MEMDRPRFATPFCQHQALALLSRPSGFLFRAFSLLLCHIKSCRFDMTIQSLKAGTYQHHLLAASDPEPHLWNLSPWSFYSLTAALLHIQNKNKTCGRSRNQELSVLLCQSKNLCNGETVVLLNTGLRPSFTNHEKEIPDWRKGGSCGWATGLTEHSGERDLLWSRSYRVSPNSSVFGKCAQLRGRGRVGGLVLDGASTVGSVIWKRTEPRCLLISSILSTYYVSGTFSGA